MLYTVEVNKMKFLVMSQGQGLEFRSCYFSFLVIKLQKTRGGLHFIPGPPTWGHKVSEKYRGKTFGACQLHL